MTTAYTRMVEVVEDTEIRTMLFEWLEKDWQIVVLPGLLGKEASRIHPIAGRNTYKPFCRRSLSRCGVD